MVSDGLLHLAISLDDKYNERLFYQTIVTDDDTKLKKYTKHLHYLPNEKTNIGEHLPLHIPEPSWFADLTHRAKCVAGVFLYS